MANEKVTYYPDGKEEGGIVTIEKLDKTIIFFDEGRYNVNKDMITALSISTIAAGQSSGFDTRRLEYGRLDVHTNPTRITAAEMHEAIARVINYILSCDTLAES